MDVFTGCFFVDGDGKASLAPALLGGKQKIFETVMTTQARKLRGAYIEYADDIPGEFFLDFDIGAKKPHCLTGSDKYPKHDEALRISIHGRANTARTRRRSRLPI